MNKQIIERLKEPSTYAGLGILLGLVGVQIAPETWALTVQAVTSVFALLAVILKEDGR